jgi:hypothetical protein
VSTQLQMGIFRRIETGLEKAFEGGFGRTFKSNVQPAELARKLRKEMDDHRTISVSQVYVPNIYTVYLATLDREQFATYEASLRTELAAYLAEHARRQAYTVPGRVRVVIETAPELELGMFGISVATEEEPRMPDLPPHSREALLEDDLPPEFRDGALPPPVAASLPPGPRVPLTMAMPAVPVAAPPLAPPRDEDVGGETALISAEDARRAGLVRSEWSLVWEGGTYPVSRRSLVIGRGRECDLVIDDRNVSRRHAELTRDGEGFTLRDLDSTNGTAVNGRRVRLSPVAAGDTIMLGTVVLTLEETRT